MRRLLLIPLLLLVFPALADAKGIAKAEVCGTDGCTRLPDQSGFGLVDGGGAGGPGSAQPFVEVNVTFVGDAPPGEPVPRDVLIFQFLPKAGLMRNEEGLWHRPDAATVAMLRKESAALSQFPATKLMQLAPELAPPPAPEPAQAPASPAPDDDGFPWGAIALAALAALIAAGAVVATVRRRRAATST